MERPPNDFDQEIFNQLCDEKETEKADTNPEEQDRNNWWDDEQIFI